MGFGDLALKPFWWIAWGFKDLELQGLKASGSGCSSLGQTLGIGAPRCLRLLAFRLWGLAFKALGREGLGLALSRFQGSEH